MLYVILFTVSIGLDLFKIYVTINTKVVKLGSCDADHINMIILLHTLSEKTNYEHKQSAIMFEIEKMSYIPVTLDLEASSSTPHKFMGDNPTIDFSCDKAGEVGLGDESCDDGSIDVGEVPAMRSLVVLYEVPEDADSCDEVSSAKLARVMKSNPFKQLGFNFNKVKNDKTRQTWACMAKGCPWRLHASNVGDETTMQVKTYKNEHTCVISHLLRDQFNVIVDTQRMYKAKKMALEVLLKDHEACLKHLRAYAIMRKGFLEGCRPFLGLDGCHLKGPYEGILLSTIALDANIDKPICFMSDRQKGVIGALIMQWPRASIRFCARHIYANFKTAYSGQKLRTLFGRASKTADRFEFKKCLEDIGEGKYEMLEVGRTYTTNLHEKTYECGQWQVSGVPCSHALVGIRHHYGVNGDEGNLAEFIDPMLSKSVYLRTYNSMIHPIPDLCVWADLETSHMDAPTVKRLPRRPRLVRKRESGEKQKAGKTGTVRKKVLKTTDDVSVSSSQGDTTSSQPSTKYFGSTSA
ncbi:hypothetical protein EZV62_018258 [Acer yangbiense]|uniref:Transposase MuDR plant domain-containing protein n=1 Tax=Acer yangbiense TaxID=1000413 RepID=A0A5C7HJK0_9ROSI|nr:hypothetical protein EZV62_018258 [Acer yangbiense]